MFMNIVWTYCHLSSVSKLYEHIVINVETFCTHCDWWCNQGIVNTGTTKTNLVTCQVSCLEFDELLEVPTLNIQIQGLLLKIPTLKCRKDSGGNYSALYQHLLPAQITSMLQGKNYHEQCYTCSDCTESLSGQFVCAAPNDEIVCFQCDTKRRGWADLSYVDHMWHQEGG